MTASVKEQFLKDVANHGISVMHDKGVYRHVRFRQFLIQQCQSTVSPAITQGATP